MSVASIGFDIYARDRASATFDKLGGKVDKTTGFFQKHKAAIVGGAAAAGAAIVSFGKDSVEAYVDAEKSQRVLEDAYKRFPKLADVNIEKLRDQAAALQNKTKFDGDDVNAMQGQLAQYKLTGTQIQQLTPLVLDYAAKTGRDLPTAAQVVGKAMLGQGKALKDVGINFKNAGSQSKNFEQLMGGLRSQVGGFAENEGKSAEGQAAILANNFGDIQEQIGSKLLPVGKKLIGWLISAVDWMQQNSGVAKLLVGVVGTLVVGIGGLMILNKVRAAMLALNLTMAANPIGLVVVAIAALAAGLVWAYNNSKTFRNIVDSAFRAIGAVARWLWNSVYAPFFRFLVNGFATVCDWVANLLDALGNIPGFGWAKDAAGKMRGAASAARGLASNIRDIPDNTTVNVTTRFIYKGYQAALSKSNAAKLAANGIKEYARGGTNIPEGWAIVGEEGPELAYLPGGSSVIPAGQTQRIMSGRGGGAGGFGGPQEIHVHVTLDGREIQRSLLRIDRQGG